MKVFTVESEGVKAFFFSVKSHDRSPSRFVPAEIRIIPVSFSCKST